VAWGLRDVTGHRCGRYGKWTFASATHASAELGDSNSTRAWRIFGMRTTWLFRAVVWRVVVLCCTVVTCAVMWQWYSCGGCQR
jgi:hypothetical protein